jgi:hypothetical protein
MRLARETRAAAIAAGRSWPRLASAALGAGDFPPRCVGVDAVISYSIS